jgi:hypothetical protein
MTRPAPDAPLSEADIVEVQRLVAINTELGGDGYIDAGLLRRLLSSAALVAEKDKEIERLTKSLVSTIDKAASDLSDMREQRDNYVETSEHYKHCVKADYAEKTRLQALLTEAGAMLQQVQWKGDSLISRCPICEERKEWGHSSSCALAALIEKVGKI